MLVSLKRSYFVFFSLFTILSCVTSLTHAEIDTAWLVSAQNFDGSYSAQNEIASRVQSTSEVIFTLKAINQQVTGLPVALDFINAETYLNTENRARQIIANVELGQDVSVLKNGLLSHQNIDGGFGELPDYHSTALDTAYAVEALASAGGSIDKTFNYAVSYLLNRQNVDGSWSGVDNASSSYVTVTVALALQKAQLVLDVSSNITKAHDFLLTYLGNNLDKTETFERALSVLSIALSIADKSVYQFLVDQLSADQNADGSWGGDVYTTALAIRALSTAETSSPLQANLSEVTGVVVDSNGQPLVNVAISASNNSNNSICCH